jgi:S1-C subfamily serine protease
VKWLTLLLSISLVSCAHRETTYVYGSPLPVDDPVFKGVAQIFLDRGEKQVTGTAFAIADNGIQVYMLTADHLCQKVGHAVVATTIPPHVGVREKYAGRVVYTAEDGDTCIIRLEEASGAFSVLGFAPESPRVGARVYTIGAPSGAFPTKTEGYVVGYDFLGTEVDESGDPKMILITSVPAYGGNSGGPVYNERHEVVGMISAVHHEYPHSSISVHMEFLLEHLDTYFKEDSNFQ